MRYSVLGIIQYAYPYTAVILRTLYIGQYRIVYIVANTDSNQVIGNPTPLATELWRVLFFFLGSVR
jgi:hypothetical protein